MSNARVAMFLETRNMARRRGDVGLANAMDAELDHLGYIEPENLSGRPESVVIQMPERAVRAKPRKRTPRASVPNAPTPPKEAA